MTMKLLEPTKAPCKTCPYRRDVPAGIWHESEYAKLAEYDLPFILQPHTLFHCHTEPEKLCAGWFHCHGHETLALRFAAAAGKLKPGAFSNKVPLFASGTEAAEHGRSGITSPCARAKRAVARLIPKIKARKRREKTR